VCCVKNEQFVLKEFVYENVNMYAHSNITQLYYERHMGRPIWAQPVFEPCVSHLITPVRLIIVDVCRNPFCYFHIRKLVLQVAFFLRSTSEGAHLFLHAMYMHQYCNNMV
jgi:hypothetical protein